MLIPDEILKSCFKSEERRIIPMSDYLLRGIPHEVWLKARVKSTRLGIPLKKVLIQLIRSWVDNHLASVDNELLKQKIISK
jgi:hypothetical protein